MIMLHTCAGLQGLKLVLLSLFIVAVLTTGQEIATINFGTTGEKPHGTPNTLRNQQNRPSNTKILENIPGNATSMGTSTHEHLSQSQPH